MCASQSENLSLNYLSISNYVNNANVGYKGVRYMDACRLTDKRNKRENRILRTLSVACHRCVRYRVSP